MRHILSRVGILFWPLSHLAQNNPDLEYKQYGTQRGERAAESATRHTVQKGVSTPAVAGERFRDFRQSVGPQILTQIVIRINSCSVNELTDCADTFAADYRETASVWGQRRPPAWGRSSAEQLVSAESSTYQRYRYLILVSGRSWPVARDCDTRSNENRRKQTWYEYACK